MRVAKSLLKDITPSEKSYYITDTGEKVKIVIEDVILNKWIDLRKFIIYNDNIVEVFINEDMIKELRLMLNNSSIKKVTISNTNRYVLIEVNHDTEITNINELMLNNDIFFEYERL